MVGQLKMNGSVKAAAFSPDGETLYSVGGESSKASKQNLFAHIRHLLVVVFTHVPSTITLSSMPAIVFSSICCGVSLVLTCFLRMACR